ncbi:hypothetical protein ACVWYQ_003662 [Bradyrhizobium sp. USDA 3397]
MECLLACLASTAAQDSKVAAKQGIRRVASSGLADYVS